MTHPVQELWPLAAVVALASVLALQIPRKALFFAPAQPEPAEVFATFAEYRPEAYAELVQKVRMSWQVRTHAVDPGAESRLDALEFDEEVPPPAALPLPGTFAARAPLPEPNFARPDLLPPTRADRTAPRPVAAPPDDAAEARALRADLLALPPSLQETE